VSERFRYKPDLFKAACMINGEVEDNQADLLLRQKSIVKRSNFCSVVLNGFRELANWLSVIQVLLT